MTTKRKKGSSFTPRAEDRHWYARKQAARRAGTRSGGQPEQPPARRRGGPRAEPADSRQRPAPRPGRPAATPVPGGQPEVVAGRNPVIEALRAGVPGTALYVAQRGDGDDRVREAVTIAADAGVSVIEATRGELDRLTGGALHQGVALQIPPFPYVEVDDLLAAAASSGRPALLVALDSVTDPRNLGAVARSAAAFGGHGLVVPARRAAGVTAGAWKASAGTLARLPVARVTNLTRTLTALKTAGLFVVGLDAGGDTLLADIPVAAEPLVLVVGSEGRGLSRLVAQSCDLLVRIPMPGEAESLNAAVAAGVALYEIARARSSVAPVGSPSQVG